MKRFLMIVGGLVVLLGGGVAVLKVQTGMKLKADAAPIERRHPEMLAQLDRLKRVATLMKDRAPLDADSGSLPLTQASFKKYAKPVPDGAFVDESQLADDRLATDFSQPHSMALDERPFWGRCIAWVLTGTNPDGDPPRHAHVIEEEIERFLAVKYVGVARAVDYRAPEAIEAGTFSVGRYRFDIFFFELTDEPHYLGGFRVDAVNSPKVRYEYREQSRNMDQTEWLIRNLRYQTQVGLIEGLTKRAPGVVMHDREYFLPDIEKHGD